MQDKLSFVRTYLDSRKEVADLAPDKDDTSKFRRYLIQLTCINWLRMVAKETTDGLHPELHKWDAISILQLSPDSGARKLQMTKVNHDFQGTYGFTTQSNGWRSVVSQCSQVGKVLAHYPDKAQEYAQGNITGFDALYDALSARTCEQQLTTFVNGLMKNKGFTGNQVIDALVTVHDLVEEAMNKRDNN